MALLTETGRYPGEFLMTEANGHRSRDAITVLSGSGVLYPGTVLAKVTASGKYVPAVDTASDGSQTAVAVLLYKVDATSADVVVAAITRAAEVNGNCLSYDASVNNGTKKNTKIAQLAAASIIVR
jgi:hypothetical protein